MVRDGLRPISWPSSPKMLVIDWRERTFTQYSGRTRLAGWTWDEGAEAEIDSVLVEKVRLHGVGKQAEGGRVA